jgi:hypothetical protein
LEEVMKISVYIKDPDVQEALVEKRLQKVWEDLGRWVDCQEYITIDFDTEAGTATVRARQ